VTGSPLGPDDLVLCAATAGHVPLSERVPAAAEAGYRGLSLFPSDVTRARREGLSDADLRALFADHRVHVADLDPLLTWVPGGKLPPGAEAGEDSFFRYTEEDFYRIHEALGARSINAALLLAEAPPRNALVDAFGELCERARRHELIVHLEPMPFGVVRDLPSAVDIVEGTGLENAGVLLDTWHHFRSGGDAESLRAAPRERILALQVSDAPAEAEADLVDETLHRRRVPGEGDIPLAEWLAILREGGAPAPVGVEIFDDDLQARPMRDIARISADAVRAVLPG